MATGLGQMFAVLLNAALSVLSWVRKPGDSMTQAEEDFFILRGVIVVVVGTAQKAMLNGAVGRPILVGAAF